MHSTVISRVLSLVPRPFPRIRERPGNEANAYYTSTVYYTAHASLFAQISNIAACFRFLEFFYADLARPKYNCYSLYAKSILATLLIHSYYFACITSRTTPNEVAI